MKQKEIELTIDSLAIGGKGVARNENMVYFVDGALPGQEVLAKIVKKKKSYVEAKLLKVIKRSEKERDTPFQSVPGNPWIQIPINDQLVIKKAQVEDCFLKFAKLSIKEKLDECISSPLEFSYRNKMEYSFGPSSMTVEDNIFYFQGFGLGSKKRGVYYIVENLETSSGLFDTFFEEKMHLIRKFLKKNRTFSLQSNPKKWFFQIPYCKKKFLY